MRVGRSRRLDTRAVRLRLRSQASPPADGDEGSARWQGRQPRRDDQRVGPAGAAGLHHLHRRLPGVHGRRVAGRARRRDRQTRRPSGAQDGPPARRPERPAPRQRAVGRQVLDARDDGHRLEPRAQRPQRQGARRRHRRALRLRLVPPLPRDVRAHRARHRRRLVRAPARGRQGQGRGHQRRRALGRRAAGAERAVQVRGPRGDRKAVPAGSDGAAPRRRRGRLRELERRAGDRLSGARADQPRPGHGRQRAGDGVRQPRRQLGHRRRLHAQRRHRREQGLRRLPHQRPG